MEADRSTHLGLGAENVKATDTIYARAANEVRAARIGLAKRIAPYVSDAWLQKNVFKREG